MCLLKSTEQGPAAKSQRNRVSLSHPRGKNSDCKILSAAGQRKRVRVGAHSGEKDGHANPETKGLPKAAGEVPRHWTEIAVGQQNPTEVARARRRLAEEIMGKEGTKRLQVRGLVFPRWRAAEHPAAALLKQYATNGCPVDVGRAWTLEELDAAVEQGPHASALEPDAIDQIQKEAREKESQGFAKVHKWEDLRANLAKHPQLKISPLAMIPHKSRRYRAILDLLFKL